MIFTIIKKINDQIAYDTESAYHIPFKSFVSHWSNGFLQGEC